MPSSCLAMNLRCALAPSALQPKTSAFILLKFGSAFVNSQASIVHPGVSSRG